MFEARDLQTFQVIFLRLIAAIICLVSTERVVFAAEKVDQSNLPEWDDGWTHINPDPNGQARMWQTFTPDYSNITAVEIDILTVNTGQFDDIITVEIAKDGQILTSTERDVEYGFEGLLRFEFDETVPVIPGELYELKVRDTGLTRFGWKYASNTYKRGTRYVSASERPGTDWFFQTYSLEPRIIYVDDDAAGANDGSSWEDAYIYLQDALADANSTEKPVEIHIAQGIYKPHQSQVPILEFFWRSTSFELINGVVLKGGYAGIKEPEPNARYIVLYETILSGDLYGDDAQGADPCNLPDEPTRAENSFHVVMANKIDNTAVLEGFTITGGNANGPDYFNFSFGGGMYNLDSNPTLTNCIFEGNTSSYGYGGGMYNKDSNPNLTNCTFNGNASRSGGGGMSNFMNSSPSLTNCIFLGNYAGFGGGMVNSYNSRPTLTGCIFSQNLAWWGGGMDNDNSSPTLTDCIFNQNSGGGLSNDNSSPTLSNCTFSLNSTENYGGGVDNWENSNPTLTNCTFTGNLAENGGGMNNAIRSYPTLTNCTFSHNSAEYYGGGISNFASSPILSDCTFVQNSAENGNALSCDIAVDIYRSDPNNVEVINCILWDGGNEIVNNDVSTIMITYSNIQGGFPGEGNIDVDPLFARLGYWADVNNPSIAVEPNDPNAVWIDGDYHLKSDAGRWDPVSESWAVDDVTSPCIDAGDPNSPVGDEPEPNGGRINMGAYGGTAEASKSDASELLQTAQELIRDFGLKPGE